MQKHFRWSGYIDITVRFTVLFIFGDPAIDVRGEEEEEEEKFISSKQVNENIGLQYSAYRFVEAMHCTPRKEGDLEKKTAEQSGLEVIREHCTTMSWSSWPCQSHKSTTSASSPLSTPGVSPGLKMWGGQKGGLEAEPWVGSWAPGQVKLTEAESLLVLVQ